MKISPFSQSISSYAENKFVTDKSGTTYFFPWGPAKTGYALADMEIRNKYIRFYSWTYRCFLVAIAISIFYFWSSNSFFFAFVPPLLIFGIWLLVHWLYTRGIVQALPVAKKKYHDLVPEKNGSKQR